MDYVVGSIAALLSGNVTPNRPKQLRNAQTPLKHQPSPNVTPKSEFVEDRSIFLSPTMQKKKAMAKKSPKRIFQNPDPDVTNGEDIDSSLVSPKADKVKKHLKDELEAPTVLLSPKSPKHCKVSPKKGNKKRLSDNIVIVDENSPKKKKRKSETVANESMIPNRDGTTKIDTIENSIAQKKNKKHNEFIVEEFNISATSEISSNTSVIVSPSPKKDKKKNKTKKNENIDIVTPNTITNGGDEESNNKDINPNAVTETQGLMKKKKNKRKKKPEQTKDQIESVNNSVTDMEVDSNNSNKLADTTTETQGPKKRKNKKKNKAKLTKEIESNMEIDSNNQKKAENTPTTDEQIRKKKNKKTKQSIKIDQDDAEAPESVEVNPNAVTNQDSDSEHDSDDEINSEDEAEMNKKVLDTGPADQSSDEEETPKEQSKPKTDEKKLEQKIAEEEVKRTLFVGNVPFSAKTKKEIKKIFSKYGKIESVRIRTVPVKDARDTPKLAVIKQELHPDRSTVNVYVRFADADAVRQALAENNTVLNDCHLRVQPSNSSGVPHDPKCSIFVGNLPFTLEDEALRGKFENCGEIESVRIIRDKATCIGKGFGYVNFKSKDGVELALAMTEEDLSIKNRILRVKRCTQPTERQLQPKQRFNKPKIFGGGRQDSGKKGNFRRQDQGNEAGNSGRGKFGGRPDFGKNDNFRRQEQGNEGGNAGRGKFGGRPNFGKKDNFRRQEQGNEGGNFGRGKFGDRPDFGKKDNFRRQEQGNEGGNFGRGKFGDRPDFGKKDNFRRQEQGTEGRNFGRGKFGDRPDFGKKDNFRRQEQGNEGGNFGRGKFGGRPDFGNKDNFKSDDQDGDKNSGAYRRIMNKRKNEESGEGPPSKKQNADQPPREKKERKEFVGMTAEKKKKNKFSKELKKKKILSEILTKI